MAISPAARLRRSAPALFPFFTCQTANASPVRSIGRDREAHRGRFFLRPLANEGVERREALGAGSARTLACPTGHAATPDEASRAPNAGRAPPGAPPRHLSTWYRASRALPPA